MSQVKEILAYLERGRALTPLMALDKFGAMRLAARIGELRGAGHRIQSSMCRLGKKRWAVYSLRP